MTTRRSIILSVAILLPVPQARAGAWGPGSFENDGALDWILDFKRTPTTTFVRATLERVVSQSEVDSIDGQAAIAAAEVVASALANSTESLPAEIRRQAADLTPETRKLAQLATTAVRRVAGERSELRDLWSAREDSRLQWKRQVEELLRRLTKHAA